MVIQKEGGLNQRQKIPAEERGIEQAVDGKKIPLCGLQGGETLEDKDPRW